MAAGKAGPGAVQLRQPGMSYTSSTPSRSRIVWSIASLVRSAPRITFFQLQSPPQAARVDLLRHEEPHRRGTAEHGRLEIGQEIALQLEIPRTGRNRHRPEPFHAQLESGPRRPQPVTDADLHAVLARKPRHLIAACKHVLPVVEVLPRVAEDLPFPVVPRRSGCGGYPAWDRQERKRVSIRRSSAVVKGSLARSSSERMEPGDTPDSSRRFR